MSDFFLKRYGPTLYEEIYKPFITKIHGKHSQNLTTELAYIFQLNRILLFTGEQTKDLKKNPWYDDRLAFQRAIDGPPSLAVNYYPKNGGVGAWISILEKKLQDSGVEIYTGEKVVGVESKSNSVSALQLEKSGVIQTDHLVWTIPPSLLSKTLGLSTKASPPQFIGSSLTFLTYDVPYKCPSYYVLNHDPKHQSYRITLFDNFARDPSNNKRICVESFQPDGAPAPSADQIHRELIQMGIVAENTAPTYDETFSVKNGFPVMTKSLVSEIEVTNEVINDQFKNITLCGKASGRAFFMTDTLADTYSSMCKVPFECPQE